MISMVTLTAKTMFHFTQSMVGMYGTLPVFAVLVGIALPTAGLLHIVSDHIKSLHYKTILGKNVKFDIEPTFLSRQGLSVTA